VGDYARTCPYAGQRAPRQRYQGLIRRFLYRRPDPFGTVRDLGLVSPCCPGGFGSSEGRSSAWLPAWLPAARPAGTTNGFQEHARFAVRHGSYVDVQHLVAPRCPRSSRVYPMPVASRYRSPFGDDLIRRSGHIVHDRLPPPVGWSDVPSPSARVGHLSGAMAAVAEARPPYR
jgi:hypothetical protein